MSDSWSGGETGQHPRKGMNRFSVSPTSGPVNHATSQRSRCVASATGSRDADRLQVLRSTYLPSTSSSRLTAFAGRAPPSVVTASVCGISATLKPRGVRLDDGERDAFDGDRALGHELAGQLVRAVDAHQAVLSVRGDRADACPCRRRDPARCGRRAAPSARIARSRFSASPALRAIRARCSRKRLWHRLERERAAAHRDHRQTAAGDARRCRRSGPRAARSAPASISSSTRAALRLEPRDARDAFDDPGEHRPSARLEAEVVLRLDPARGHRVTAHDHRVRQRALRAEADAAAGSRPPSRRCPRTARRRARAPRASAWRRRP